VIAGAAAVLVGTLIGFALLRIRPVAASAPTGIVIAWLTVRGVDNAVPGGGPPLLSSGHHLCFQSGNYRVAAMETYGPIDADEASAALASVRHSRTRVAWSGYPAWYWLTTGAALGAASYAMRLPAWQALAISAALALLLVMVAHAASRARGVCEGWTRSAMTHRDRVILSGPAAVVVLASAAAPRFASWPPWAPAAAAVLVSVLFAGTGLTLSARAARR
jgi:hypothetical protein